MLEYKTANELKPKELIIDPDTDELYQVINIKSGNKPRIIYRNMSSDKVSEIVVSAKKQFLLAEREELVFQVNYYSGDNIHVMDYSTYEEKIFDGSPLGKKLESLKREFDQGKGIEIVIERIGEISTVIRYSILKEELHAEPPALTTSETQKDSSRESDDQKEINQPIKKALKKEKKQTVKSLSNREKKKPKEKKSQKHVKREKRDSSRADKKSSPTKELSNVGSVAEADKLFNYKEFKGLGEKTFKLLAEETGLKTLNDFLRINEETLLKIPKITEKKVKEWRKKAENLLEDK